MGWAFRWVAGGLEATGEWLLTVEDEFIRVALADKESGRGMVPKGLGCLMLWVILDILSCQVRCFSNESGIV